MSTLAEQVVEQLKTDMDNVYDAGYQKGKSEGGVDYLKYVKEVAFDNLSLFGKSEITFDLLNLKSMAYFYQPTLLTNGHVNNVVKHITINCPNQINSMRCSFDGNSIYDDMLEHITLNVDTSKCQWWMYSFHRMYALKTIDGTPLDLSSVNANGYSNMFRSSDALQNVAFKAQSIVDDLSFGGCSMLSDESIQSIIDGLADLTGQTSQTLTFHADVKAKLTEEQIATITSKNWTLA